MAPNKRVGKHTDNPSTGLIVDGDSDLATVADQKTAAASQAELPLKLRHYAIINVAFLVFCIIQLIIVYFTLPDSQGVFFFFALLVFAFFLVSFTEYLFERSNQRDAI